MKPLVAALLVVLAFNSSAAAAADPILQVDQGRLIYDAQPFNWPSVNMFDLAYLYSVNPSVGRARLEEAKANGFRVVRFFAAGLYDESQVAFPVVDSWKNTTSRPSFYAFFDALMADADALDIKVIPVLVTGFSDASERYRPSGAACANWSFSLPMLPGSDNRKMMQSFALDVVARYRQSDAVLFWSLGNELNLQAKHRNPSILCVTQLQIADYMNDLARRIKSIDALHLVSSGAIQESYDTPVDQLLGDLNDAQDYFQLYNGSPYVDIAEIHIYGSDYKDAAGRDLSTSEVVGYFRSAASNIGKPLWIGEFGVPSGIAWSEQPFHDDVMSLLLARYYLGVDLATAWTWQSKYLGSPTHHPEMIEFSLDPIEDGDAIAMVTDTMIRLGRDRVGISWTAHSADYNGDGRDDLLAVASRGLWQVSVMGETPTVPAQWISRFSDELDDLAGAPFQHLSGDWNGDGMSDVAAKSRDGRWLVALSDGFRFTSDGLWLAGFGNDFVDGSSPFIALSGDWNGDGKTDVGAMTQNGRWYTATSTGLDFSQTRLATSGFTGVAGDLSDVRVFAGDWNGDGKCDVGVKTLYGNWYVALSTGTDFSTPTLWLSGFGNDFTDNGSPFYPMVGDWNGDGKAEVGARSRDGRWFTAISSGASFGQTRLAMSGFADEQLDGSGFHVVTGDWNGDTLTDIGAKAKDGRWFIATGTGTSFHFPAAWH